MTRYALFQGYAIAFAVQATLAAGQQPSFRTETRLVVLHATVLNDRGERVTNLDQRAFTVYENGKRQPIALFRRDDIPISVGLLIDNSGSMRPLRSRVEAAALAFARASNPQDELFVLNFADRVRVDVPMTSDLHVLEAGIGRADSIGGTALRDAVQTGELYLRDHAKWDRRVLLIITDGYDNASDTTIDQIRRQAEQTDTTIEAIGLFGGDDQGKIRTGRHELTLSPTEREVARIFPLGSIRSKQRRSISRGRSEISTRSPTLHLIRGLMGPTEQFDSVSADPRTIQCGRSPDIVQSQRPPNGCSSLSHCRTSIIGVLFARSFLFASNRLRMTHWK